VKILGQRFNENAEGIYEDWGVAEQQTDACRKNDHPAVKEARPFIAHSEVSHLALSRFERRISCCGADFCVLRDGNADQVLPAVSFAQERAVVEAGL
jgi:hypothetical protein